MSDAPPERIILSHLNYGEETKRLLVLLVEYSDRLSILCDEIEIYEAKKGTRMFLFSLLSMFVGVIYYVVVFVVKDIVLSPVFERVRDIFAVAYFSFIFLMFLSKSNGIRNHSKSSNRSAFHFLSPFGYFFVGLKKEERLIRELKLYSKKLEKIIRIASQFQDSLGKNTLYQLEMDLRLTDAELVLERSLLHVK
jgi:hypothetical protein